MKRFLIITTGFWLFSIAFFSSTLTAQNEQTIDRRLIVKVSPLGTFAGFIPMSVEYFISPRFSAGLNAAYQNFSSGSLDNTLEQDGYGVGPELRYYFVENKKEDYFSKVYLMAMYNYESISNFTKDRFENEYPGSVYGSGTGVFFGHQFFYKSRFVMDLYVGPAYYKYFKNDNYDQNITKASMFMSMANARSSGTKVKIGFSLGIRF